MEPADDRLVSEIRTRFEQLTGYKATGVLEEVQPGVYRCWSANNRVDVDRADHFVVIISDEGTSVQEVRFPSVQGKVWSNWGQIDVAPLCAQMLIYLVGAPDDLELRFQRLIEEPSGVHRQFFDSQIGPVIWHTRKLGPDTDTCAELPAQGLLLHFLWEAATGRLPSESIRKVESVPF